MERVKEAEKGDRSEEDQACQDLLPGTVTAEKKNVTADAFWRAGKRCHVFET